jgi:hypothetical protein
MGQWVIVADDFIEADVIRWKESVFQSRNRKAKPIRLGQRLVVAEVLRREGEWVHCLVRHCEFVSVQTGLLERQIPLLRSGAETKRKRSTIAKGNAERLLWSDESARSLIASRFLGKRMEDSES